MAWQLQNRIETGSSRIFLYRPRASDQQPAYEIWLQRYLQESPTFPHKIEILDKEFISS